MTAKQHFRAYLPSIAGGLLIFMVIGLIIYFISNIKEKPEKKERKIQAISLSKPPPPPPPPPPKVEKLPEPEPEQKIEEQPEPEPEEIPDVADEAPPGDLGLDAEGTAGADGFGLAARKGGKGLFGGANPFAWYGNTLKNDIMNLLSDKEVLRRKDYTAIIKLWVEADGSIKRVELAKGTNDAEIDALITKEIGKYKTKNPPPPGMEQPIKLKIKSGN